jgi:hypothetical protein
VSLIAVPVATANIYGSPRAQLPDAIRSAPELAENVSALRWTLAGRQLVGLLPAAVRASR